MRQYSIMKIRYQGQQYDLKGVTYECCVLLFESNFATGYGIAQILNIQTLST